MFVAFQDHVHLNSNNSKKVLYHNEKSCKKSQLV